MCLEPSEEDAVLARFTATAVLMFPAGLTSIGAAMGKRHPDQGETLQFTRRNWWSVRDDPGLYRGLGMTVWLPPMSEQDAGT